MFGLPNGVPMSGYSVRTSCVYCGDCAHCNNSDEKYLGTCLIKKEKVNKREWGCEEWKRKVTK